MRFKTDENLPEEFAEVLRAAGWDAWSVVEQAIGCSRSAMTKRFATASTLGLSRRPRELWIVDDRKIRIRA
jgi:hypothetical protein